MKTVAICAVGATLMAFAATHKLADSDDFSHFYRAAQLVRSHQSVYTDISPAPGRDADAGYCYIRIPAYAAALQPLVALTYASARRAWTVATYLALLACVWLFPGRRKLLVLALALSFPVALTVALGQDTAFVLLVVLAAARVYELDQEFLAGLTASLLAFKLTYLPSVGVVFLAKSRRGTLGLVVGVAIQLALSFAMEGAGWPFALFNQLRNPLFDPEPRRMPNLKGVVASLGLPGGLYLIGAVVLFLALWYACRRLSPTDAFLLALPITMIASPHNYGYDAVVLVPLLVSTANMETWRGMLAGVALTPLPWLLLMTNGPVTLPLGSILAVASTLAAAAGFVKLRRGIVPSSGSVDAVASPSYG